MTLIQRDEGDYCIFCGAIEGTKGDGYIAAVVVNYVGNRAPTETFRDNALACGHRWPSTKAALSYAMAKGREIVKTEQDRDIG
jgi:hypothetical protein